MSLLLCRKPAEKPFCFERIDLKLWSLQELCFVIFNYPLLCMDGLLGEGLFDWLENALKMKQLSLRVRSAQRSGESVENLLLMILHEGNYYDVSEIRSFGVKIAEFRNYSREEFLYRSGRVFFEAGRLRQAYERFEAAVREIDLALIRVHEEKARHKLLAKKAEILCDMAVVRLRLFDQTAALDLLAQSEMTLKNARADRLRYTVIGVGDISEEEKEEIDRRKEELREQALESPSVMAVEEVFDNDRVRLFKEAGEVISRWKSEYRRMN